jgi:NADH-quinone oxidoreductase subunit A
MPNELVGFVLVFVLVGVAFIFIHLLAGKLVRPAKPDPEKMTIYECGEPTIGSSWVQFDLRFYVVALLFVIFDVEVAFFFPWAVVFGKVNELADPDLAVQQRIATTAELTGVTLSEKQAVQTAINQASAARAFGRIAFVDILIFFGVLLVGFAYLWKRGDLNWVRSIAAEQAPAVTPDKSPSPRPGVEEFAGVGQST